MLVVVFLCVCAKGRARGLVGWVNKTWVVLRRIHGLGDNGGSSESLEEACREIGVVAVGIADGAGGCSGERDHLASLHT